MEEDDEPFTFRGMQADIEHLVFTNLLLALPIRFLCRKNCRGMLDEQDADRIPHNPFSVLNQLLLRMRRCNELWQCQNKGSACARSQAPYPLET